MTVEVWASPADDHRTKNHRYTSPVTGKQIPGVTGGILGTVSTPFFGTSPAGTKVSLDCAWTAEAVVRSWKDLAKLDPFEREEAIATMASRKLNGMSEFGVDAHLMLAALAHGDASMLNEVHRANALPVIPLLIGLADVFARWVTSEMVLINDTAGYGGQCDGIVYLVDGRCALLDLKTRQRVDQVSATWDKELVQCELYARAEYGIAIDPATGETYEWKLPHIDTLAIATVHPDRGELHLVDR